MSRRFIGFDLETYDPLLKKRGWSWKYGMGKVLCYGLYSKEEGADVLHACREDPKARGYIESILTDPNVTLVGANIIYDLGWTMYDLGWTDTYKIKCRVYDVLQAEHILDEFGHHTLESVSQHYLHKGKVTFRIEEWVRNNVKNVKGDFRAYLKDAPWELLCEYVTGDVMNPIEIMDKQVKRLVKEGLAERAKLEFDCNLPTLQMTINGFPFDNEQRKKNCAELKEFTKQYQKSFGEKYGMQGFNPNSSKQIAKLCDMYGIPYNCKITLKGYNGRNFTSGAEKDSACMDAKRIVSQMRLVKGEPVAMVPVSLAERTCDLLKENGFMVSCSPSCDKKFFASARNNYEVIGIVADWKLCNGILSKLLDNSYAERFVCPDGRIRPQFNITNTKSFRFSSCQPNCIAGDMRVLTDKGWKKIKDLRIGDPIINGNGNLTKVKNIWNKGKQNCLLTVSANGYRIVSTAEHKVWDGVEEKEIGNCEQIGVIERRADSEVVQIYADKGTDSGCAWSRQIYRNKSSTEKSECRRVYRAEETAQDTNSRSIYESSGELGLCERVFITRTAILKRLVHKIQSFLKQGKELPEEALDCRADSRAAQYASSTGEVQEQWLYGKAEQKLQRGMFRLKRLHDSICRLCRWERQKSLHAQKGVCGSLGDRCAEPAGFIGSAPYRHQPLEQRLGQLGSVYSVSAQKVAHFATKPEEVFDIEVESEDHSFICEGFRVFNCQQVPSKGGIYIQDEELENVRTHFPNLAKALSHDDKGWSIQFAPLTRGLFHAEYESVYFKIDYGQIEYRLIANIAVGESGEAVRAKYAENPRLDYHQYVIDLTGLPRKLAKNMNFGVAFGMSEKSMCENFGWDEERGHEITKQYHTAMPFVAPTLQLVGDVAVKRGYIKTVLGSHARLPDKNKKYTMLNRYTQGSGAEIMKTAIVNIYKAGLFNVLTFHVTVHDELGASVPATIQGAEACLEVQRIMCTSVPLRVPLVADIECGRDWYNVEEPDAWEEPDEVVRAFIDCLKEVAA